MSTYYGEKQEVAKKKKGEVNVSELWRRKLFRPEETKKNPLKIGSAPSD